MPRTYSSVVSQASSTMSSSSGVSFHTAPESPRNDYPEMQARAADTRDSEVRGFLPNWWFSSRLDIVHDEDEEKEEDDPTIIKIPPRRDSDPESETSEFDSEDSSHDSEVQGQILSQPCLSDYILEPSDSISNQDHRSNTGSIPRFAPPSPFSSTDHRYLESKLYESIDGAWIRRLEPHCTHHPHGRPARQEHAPSHSDSSDQTDSLGALRDLSMNPVHRAPFSNTIDSKDLLAYFSEESGSAQQGRGGDVSNLPEAYDDDFEEPFAPRGHSDSDGESCHEDWDNGQDRGREQERWFD